MEVVGSNLRERTVEAGPESRVVEVVVIPLEQMVAVELGFRMMVEEGLQMVAEELQLTEAEGVPQMVAGVPPMVAGVPPMVAEGPQRVVEVPPTEGGEPQRGVVVWLMVEEVIQLEAGQQEAGRRLVGKQEVLLGDCRRWCSRIESDAHRRCNSVQRPRRLARTRLARHHRTEYWRLC